MDQQNATPLPNPVGRPSKYTPEVLAWMDKYYNECKQKRTMPYIEDISLELDISDDTISEWNKQHSEFSDAYNRIYKLQKKYLSSHGLAGKAQSFTIFLLKANHGMIETERIQHQGSDGQPIKLNIIGGGYTGYISEPGTPHAPPTGSDMGPPSVQGTGVAPESTKDIHINSGTGETSTA